MTEPKTKAARAAKATPEAAHRPKRAARHQAPATLAALNADDGKQPAAAKGPVGKLGVIVALMRRPEGATVAQMGEATGWQPHSVRGALAGSLKRKHKLAIVGEPGESGRVYRIVAEQSA